MILLTKRTEWCEHAGRIAKIAFGNNLTWIRGNVGDPYPDLPEGRIISFLSPWIVRNPPAGSINFHPGSSDYPGIGCYNFALHDGAQYFGAVCHYMENKVDTGLIIQEVLFPILPNDTVERLKFRTMVVMLAMFHEQVCKLANNAPLGVSGVKWSRVPFTHKQLAKLNADFPNTRATRYPDAD